MAKWYEEAIIYHIYPLGLCGAPDKNDFREPPRERLLSLLPWLDHIRDLGATALYLGPLFESTSHGYDTADYFHLDRRLGTDDTLRHLVKAAHEEGLRVILDCVFNHVGRDFWAFRDVKENGAGSPYTGWFQGLAFGHTSPYGDPFSYEGWSGHHSLVKLELRNPAVREHLFAAVDAWVRGFDIDGLRLDAADVMDLGFLESLAAHCRGLRPDFWLMGEVVHGDYRRWVNPSTLDSVTNYECYKGLYSSFNDGNLFEIAHSLTRQFAHGGIYEGKLLYSFADNHDVNRVSSTLKDPAHLHPLYCLLFSMPGIPSVYYGSEWGIEGRKNGSDGPLRPRLDLEAARRLAPHPHLEQTIRTLSHIRLASAALTSGDYLPLHVSSGQLAFARRSEKNSVIAVINAAASPARVALNATWMGGGRLVDLLNPGEAFSVSGGRAEIAVPPRWARIMSLRP